MLSLMSADCTCCMEVACDMLDNDIHVVEILDRVARIQIDQTLSDANSTSDSGPSLYDINHAPTILKTMR